MSLVVRHAIPADDARIGELLVDAFVTAYAQKMPDVVVHDERRQELRDIAAKREIAAVLVAELDGEIVGTVALFRPGVAGSHAWIKGAADLRHLATDVRHHGKGYSQALLQKTETIAFDEWKIPAICLHVRRGAVGVARLYQKRGYVREPAGDLAKPTVNLEAYALYRPR